MTTERYTEDHGAKIQEFSMLCYVCKLLRNRLTFASSLGFFEG